MPGFACRMKLMVPKPSLRNSGPKIAKAIGVGALRIHLRSKWIPRISGRVLLVGGLAADAASQVLQDRR
jgi:hypothetical protein